MIPVEAWPPLPECAWREEGLESLKWVLPKFGRGEINRAGQFVAIHFNDAENYLEQFYEAMQIVNNWRSSHSYPLHAVKGALQYRAKGVHPSALVVHRLKRFPSIALKLVRFQQMSLTQMQDIGGCRAVMPSMASTESLIDKQRSSFDRLGVEYKEYNYIQTPKSDGYRGFHFAVKYRSRSKERSIYDGLRVEVQIRSQAQHCWATAVEVASTFTGQALKSNIGEEDWKRFFALSGTAW